MATMTLHFAMMLAILSAAVIFDIWTRRIPNALVAGAIAIGVASSNWLGGTDGAIASLLGTLAAGVVFLPFFALRWLGAGDVKLFAATGAFIGWPQVVPLALYVAIAGVVLGVVAHALRALGYSFVLEPRATGQSADSEDSVVRRQAPRQWMRSIRLPYAVAIAAGSLVWLLGV